MKKVNLIALFSLVLSVSVFAQTSQKKWAVSLGAAATNHSFQGLFPGSNGIFDEFFNTDNWSIPLVNLKVGRFLSKGIVADVSAAGGKIDVKDTNMTEEVSDQLFINAGVGVQIHPLAFFGKEETKIDPYGRLGATYNYFDYKNLANKYNQRLDSKDDLESNWSRNNHAGGTIGAGVNFWFTENVGLGLETNYNLILTPQLFKGFNDSGHFWQHSASLVFRLGLADKDKDGILDKEDACPEVFGLFEFKGCPDTDSDGIKDSADTCPKEAGPKENAGCPWGDADKDGIKDNEDRCATEKGELANQGCPWGDKDNDSVKDNVDKCPNEAGDVNNNGCPVKKIAVVEEAQKITLALQNLEFESGKSIITPEGQAKLDAAATIIKSSKSKYLIAGHTDNSGAPATNTLLSKLRAEAVVSELESRGVEKGRLLSIGFGSSQPISDNASPEGQQANRRVEVSSLTEADYVKLNKFLIKPELKKGAKKPATKKIEVIKKTQPSVKKK